MNKDEIMKMEAGHELDRLIAEKVMGWKINKFFAHDEINDKNYALYKEPSIAWVDEFAPSTDIAAAWMVVEKMRTDDPFNEFIIFCDELAEMSDGNMDDRFADTYNLMASLNPLTICRAALLAVTEYE